MTNIEKNIQDLLRPAITLKKEKEIVLTVSSSDIVKINKSIEKKIRQNEAERNASMEAAAKSIVGGQT